MYYQLLNVYVLTNIKMEKYFDYKGHIYESGLIHTVMWEEQFTSW